MKINATLLIYISLLIVSLLQVAIYSIEQGGGYFFVFVLFYCSLFLMTYKLDKGLYSTFCFLFLVSLTFYYADYFFTLSGDYFLIGGDAKKYYDYAYSYGVNGDDLTQYRYWFFIFIVGKYFSVLSYLGVNPTNIEFSLLTSFFASISASIYYSIANYIVDDKRIASKVALMWIFTPLFFYLGVGQLRDIYCYFAVAFVFLLLIKDEKLGNRSLSMFLYLTILLAYISLIRVDAAIYAFVLIVGYFFFKENKIFKRFIMVGLAVVMLLLLTVMLDTLSNQLSFDNLIAQSEQYSEMCNQGCDNGSFIKAFQGSIFGTLILSVISYFTPFPSFIFENNYTLHGFFELIFVISWILISIVFFNYILITKNYSPFLKAFLLSIIFLMLLLALTTVGSYRQKIYIYPIVYSYFIFGTTCFSFQRFKIVSVAFIFFFILLIVAFSIRYLF